MIKNKTKKIRLKVYDGISGSKWNGGRIQDYQDVPVGINVTFALTRHDNIDFNDPTTIEILKAHDKPGNSLILANLELRDFLKPKFKNYTYFYSITAYDISNGYLGYLELENKFDYIVPRNEIFKDLSNFNGLDIKKYIPLYSYECSDCPLYNEHYRVIGNLTQDEYEMSKCWMKDKKLLKKAGYDRSDFDYKYTISNKWHKNIMQLIGVEGYKIGRNEQEWDEIEAELDNLVRSSDESKR